MVALNSNGRSHHHLDHEFRTCFPSVFKAVIGLSRECSLHGCALRCAIVGKPRLLDTPVILIVSNIEKENQEDENQNQSTDSQNQSIDAGEEFRKSYHTIDSGVDKLSEACASEKCFFLLLASAPVKGIAGTVVTLEAGNTDDHNVNSILRAAILSATAKP